MSTSILIVERLLAGAVPGCPKIDFGVVDVRDAGRPAHPRDEPIRAPRANAFSRFPATACRSATFRWCCANAWAQGRAKRRPGSPNWLVRLIALFDPMARQDCAAARQDQECEQRESPRALGWSPRSREDASSPPREPDRARAGQCRLSSACRTALPGADRSRKDRIHESRWILFAQPIASESSLVDLELPTPTPGPRDLRVRVRAISVNPVDYKVRHRTTPPPAKPRCWAGTSRASSTRSARGRSVQAGDEVFMPASSTARGRTANFI